MKLLLLFFFIIIIIIIIIILSESFTFIDFIDIIQRCDNVLSCHNITGGADFLLQVVARDLDDYGHFVDTVLRKLPGISDISSSISLKELKSTVRQGKIVLLLNYSDI